MKAYLVSHVTDGYGFGENVLVYHVSEEAAQELGRHCLSDGNSWEEIKAERAPQYDHRCVKMNEPEQETEEEFLRAHGWRYEGEETCAACGLAAFGQEEFAICNECQMCKECGCDTTCEGLDEPCRQSEGRSCEGMKSIDRSSKPSPPTEAPPTRTSSDG